MAEREKRQLEKAELTAAAVLEAMKPTVPTSPTHGRRAPRGLLIRHLEMIGIWNVKSDSRWREEELLRATRGEGLLTLWPHFDVRGL